MLSAFPQQMRCYLRSRHTTPTPSIRFLTQNNASTACLQPTSFPTAPTDETRNIFPSLVPILALEAVLPVLCDFTRVKRDFNEGLGVLLSSSRATFKESCCVKVSACRVVMVEGTRICRGILTCAIGDIRLAGLRLPVSIYPIVYNLYRIIDLFDQYRSSGENYEKDPTSVDARGSGGIRAPDDL